MLEKQIWNLCKGYDESVSLILRIVGIVIQKCERTTSIIYSSLLLCLLSSFSIKFVTPIQTSFVQFCSLTHIFKLITNNNWAHLDFHQSKYFLPNLTPTLGTFRTRDFSFRYLVEQKPPVSFTAWKCLFKSNEAAVRRIKHFLSVLSVFYQ